MKAPLLAALLLLTVLAIVPAASADPPQCMEQYSRTNVGTYAIVRHNTCAAPQVYDCPYAGAPLDQCDDLLVTR